MANLIIKASSGNSLVVQGADDSPAITVATDGATTFAENASFSTGNIGTLTSATTFPQGHVLQTIQGTYITETSVSSTDFEQIHADLEPSITVAGSNKVLISFSVPGYTPSNVDIVYQLYRGSTALQSSGVWGFGVHGTGGQQSYGISAGVYLDTPGAGTHQYKLWHRINPSGTGYSCINTTRSSVILQEIAV